MNQKEAFLKKDRLIKGITEDGFFKASAVKTTELVELARVQHGLSPLATVLLGRAMTGTLLLAAELKGEERIRLDIQGNGPISMMVVEANAVGEVRGYVDAPHAELDLQTAKSVGDGLGLGVLSLSKTLYNEAQAVTGTVELRSGNISDDLAYYLLQSEQVASAITVDVRLADDGSVVSAGGVLVQALPGAPEDPITSIEENLKVLSPVAETYERGMYIDDLMCAALNPLPVKELGRYPVHFFCRCTKDRFTAAINMLDVTDLETMMDTEQELVCHYCNKHYHITAAEIQEMARKKRISLN